MERLESGGIGFVTNRWPLQREHPTVIFIHGSGGSTVLWHEQLERLTRQFNAVALDLPGHGSSPGVGLGSVEEYAGAVDAFVESIGAGSVAVCGQSLGGAIVLRLLLDRQDRYDGGILVNSGARLRVNPMILEAIERDYDGFLGGMYAVGASDKTDPSKIEPLIEAMRGCSPEVTLGDFRACDAFDVMDRLEQIAVPVLVLTASADKLTPAKYGAFLADRIERSTLVNIEDAGHLSPMEKPQEVTSAIEDFVDGL